MSNYDESYEYIKRIEGVYSDDPDDKGKRTVYGISEKNNPNWEGFVIIDEYINSYLRDGLGGYATTNSIIRFIESNDRLQILVKRFYHEHYWLQIQGDKIESQILADRIMQYGVNCGVETAIMSLQRTLNTINYHGQHPYFDFELVIDGVIGEKTLERLNGFSAVKKIHDKLCDLLYVAQINHYLNICFKNPTQYIFLFGWMNRAKEGLV